MAKHSVWELYLYTEHILFYHQTKLLVSDSQLWAETNAKPDQTISF